MKETSRAVFKRPEGTADLLGKDIALWQKFLKCADGVFTLRGYKRIETPIIEREDLFKRGIGEATDVVSKEMYSAISGGNLSKIKTGENLSSRSKLALRPEGTAGTVRAICENGLTEVDSMPAKYYYAGPMFRAERPQKGRQRQFYQIGTEMLGSNSPYLDAEAVLMLLDFFNRVGIESSILTLDINSMGCEECRPAFREAVKEYIENNSEHMCDTCMERANANPLRAFDCKNETCAKIMDSAPNIHDYLCDDCKEHFEIVKSLLDASNIKYNVNNKLVRGLDYYTRTVFEITANIGLGSQSAIGGGGRYDKLSLEIGDKNLPGIGFALGFERCALVLDELGKIDDSQESCDIFIACLCSDARNIAFELANKLRETGFITRTDERDTEGRWQNIKSLKAQLKLANKLQSRYAIIIGEDEIAENKAQIKDMISHSDVALSINEIQNYFKGLKD